MAVEDRIRRNLNRGKVVRDIGPEPWWSRDYGNLLEGLAKLPETYANARMYKGNALDDTYDALTSLLNFTDTEEGMKLYEKRVAEFAADSTKFGGFADNIIQAESLKMAGNTKKQQQINFSDGVQQASDFIDSGEYLSTQSDFENLFQTVNTVNAKRKADGKNPHASPLEYLLSEKDRTLRLMDKILPGIQFNKDGLITGVKFRYNNANNNDKDTARKIMQYYKRVELATKTLEGDGIITPDEARAILVGNMDDFIKTRDSALSREKGLYLANKALFARYSGYINAAEQKKLSNNDFGFMAQDPGFTENSSEYQVLGQELGIALGEDATQDDWDNIIETLTRERNSYKTLMNTANEKYKYWSGDYYEAGGEPDDNFMIDELARQMGVSPDKYRELQKNASDAGVSINEWLETGGETESVETELIDTEEERKKEVIKRTGISGLPEVGGDATTPIGGKGESIEERLSARNKEYAKKYNTTVEHIQLLRGSYDEDDTATMDFPSYLNREANQGEFKNLSTEGAPPSEPKAEGIKIGEPLYQTYTNKREARYGEPAIPMSTKAFKTAQSNLSSIASDKFSKLSAPEKGKYKGSKKEAIRLFVKDKFVEWLKESKKFVRVYNPEDYKYFFPTKVDKSGKAIKKDVAGRARRKEYTLFYPPAFNKVPLWTQFRTPNQEADGYPRFAKDFDAFRKFLQES